MTSTDIATATASVAPELQRRTPAADSPAAPRPGPADSAAAQDRVFVSGKTGTGSDGVTLRNPAGLVLQLAAALATGDDAAVEAAVQALILVSADEGRAFALADNVTARTALDWVRDAGVLSAGFLQRLQNLAAYRPPAAQAPPTAPIAAAPTDDNAIALRSLAGVLDVIAPARGGTGGAADAAPVGSTAPEAKGATVTVEAVAKPGALVDALT